jgi:hypothetical protein
MSNDRNLTIDLNLIDNDATQAPIDYGKPQAYTMPLMPTDATPQSFVLQTVDPPFAEMMVDASQLVYTTPTFSTTPTYFAPSPAYMPAMVTPDYLGTPSFVGIPMADTPAYNTGATYRQNHRRYRRSPHVAVSCRVHNVVKRVRAFCLKNEIPLIKVIDGPNVLKISVRSVQHTQKVEKALTNIVRIDGIKVVTYQKIESNFELLRRAFLCQRPLTLQNASGASYSL